VQPGAFGPGAFAADLPLIFRSLADSANALLLLLRSPYLSNALAAGSLLAALRAGRGSDPSAGTPEPVGAHVAAEPEAGAVPPDNEKQAVEHAFEPLRDREFCNADEVMPSDGLPSSRTWPPELSA
jgi:hypothetical protein